MGGPAPSQDSNGDERLSFKTEFAVEMVCIADTSEKTLDRITD